MVRRFMAILLSVTLIFSCWSIPAFAVEEGGVDGPANTPEALQVPSSGSGAAADAAPGVEPRIESSTPVANVNDQSAVTSPAIGLKKVFSAKELVDFIYVESTKIGLNEEENIAVALFDTVAPVERAELSYRNLQTGEEKTVAASTIADGAMLFTEVFTDTSSVGDYQLQGVTCFSSSAAQSLGAENYFIDFTLDADESYSFTVVAEKTKTEVANPGKDGVVAYTLDDSGEVVASDSIEAALQSAGATTEALGVNQSKAKAASPFTLRSATPVLTIMLDPGHGGVDPGAGNPDLGWESSMTWKIASACKEKLETYYGVKVLMSRGENEPLPTNDYLDRVRRALEQGAQVFISIHVNAGGGRGVEVYVPSNNGSANTQISGELAAKVLDRLVALGLNGRGVKSGDEFAVINQSNAAGMPGILIEHGFVDDVWGDWMNWLSNDEGLRKLGVADAEAIASQFNLTTWDWKTQAWAALSGGSFDVAVEEGTNQTGSAGAPPGLQSLQVAVWGEAGGQNDMHWYDLVKESNGYAARGLSLSVHKETGVYNAHVYARVNGETRCIAVTSFTVGVPAAKISIKGQTGSSYTVSVENLSSTFGVESVLIPSWSANNGQDDLVWHVATRQADGTYEATVLRSSHGYDRGRYYSDVYVRDNFGGVSCVGRLEPYFDTPEVQASYNPATGYATLTASGSAVSSVSNVAFPVWSEAGGQDDLIWYQPEEQSDGTWKVEIPFSNHNTYGSYIVHVYTEESGHVSGYYGSSFYVDTPALVANIENFNNAGSFDVVVSSKSGGFAGVNSLKIPTWSEVDGQDDLVWYTPQRRGDKYVLHVEASNHRYSRGWYQSHVYITDPAGHSVFATSAQAELSLPSVTTTVVESGNDGYATIVAKGDMLDAVSNVAFPVWSDAGGQDDLIWYQPAYMGNGTWKAIIPYRNHKTNGSYTAHMYLAYGSQVEGYYGDSFTMRSGSHAIMGASNVGYSKMASCYRAKSSISFPSFYPASWGASSDKSSNAQNIEEFCAIIQEESAAEGVRAEVVFSQMMHETGWLRYGNDVKIEQFNFAGIGATGNGVPGNSFPNVRTGVRAQVQHLKAYASTAPLNLSKVDPRFDYVTRGCAPSVEDLGGKWATGASYGYTLVNNFLEPLLAF